MLTCTAHYRYSHLPRENQMELAVANHKRGRAVARAIAIARKAPNPEQNELWLDALVSHWYKHREDALTRISWNTIPAMTQEAFTEAQGKFDRGEWVCPEWVQNRTLASHLPHSLPVFSLPERHFMHVSTVDPEQIAYYPSLAYMLRGREVRTRVGRYLAKYFSEYLSEEVIRELANTHANQYKPKTLNFVEDDDPDGWEWVYEHANFVSCMTYDRSDRHLHDALYGEDHPVRAYAYKGNGLRLAWLGDRDAYMSDAKGVVTARAIVRDNADGEPMGYIRIYGDDSSMRAALQAAEYGNYTDLYGVTLHRREHEYGGWVICPYLDSGGVADRGDTLKVVSGGYATRADGLLDFDDGDYTDCEDCGDRIHIADAYAVGYDGHYCVCEDCRDRSYTHALGRRGDEYLLPIRDVVEVRGVWYDADYLEHNDISDCSECSGYFHTDDLVATQDGCVCEECSIRLDIESDYGYDYALANSTCETEDGKTIRKDETETCCLSGGVYHREQMFAVMVNGKKTYVHPKAMRDNPDRVKIIGVKAFGYALLLGGDTPGDSPVKYDFSYCLFTNVEVGKHADEDLYDVLYDLYDEPVAEVVPFTLAA